MKNTLSLYDIIKERILILDGGLGTMIQQYQLNEKDFHPDCIDENSQILLKGNNDLLNLSRPDVIEDIHRKYLEAGADIIETNTFNAQRISQADYACEYLCREMNLKACSIARKLADEYSQKTPKKPRFVAGSVGPTNKTCSLVTDVNHPEWRALHFDELKEAYAEQIGALLDGKIDILLIETIFDTLNAKAALVAAREQMNVRHRDVPIMISVTITDQGGHTLSGQNMQAFMASVDFVHPFSVGLNCSFGPKKMKSAMKELASMAPCYTSVYPNAGLPNELGQYDIQPAEMASLMKEYVQEGLVNIIGGCCGTTAEHIAAYADIIRDEKGHFVSGRQPVPPFHYLRLAGLEALVMNGDIPFINIGERCNVAGSRKFLRLIGEKQYEEALSIAHKQVEDGALVIDINMDDGLLDAKHEMVNFINMLALDSDVARVPVMIDSSNWEVIEEALKHVQGKSIVNSISLKEGEEKFLQKAAYIQKMGAAVVVMAFDEEGQACSYQKKIDVCKRAYKLLTERLQFNPFDIIFDPNILSIATGLSEHDDYALNYIRAVEWIHTHLPGVHISGGVSNLSFAFRGNNYIREAMHAVFLYHCVQKGMDMGIVNPASRVIYDDIPTEEKELLEDLIFNRRNDAADRLIRYIAEHNTSHTQTKLNSEDAKNLWMQQTLDMRLKKALVKGEDTYLADDLSEALTQYKRAVEIIEGPLMEGMGTVGKYFASGKMFLPQVVRTAKTMQKAVSILSPYILKENDSSGSSLGKICMATVKGDVHDIGKNIVAVVLRCNNFNVIDLGVMCPAEKIVESVLQEKADIIGLCGLITPSLTEMIHTIEALNAADINIPVIVGGATTSELHTALKIAPVYKGTVLWAKDAAQVSIIASSLMNHDKRNQLLSNYASRYAMLRNSYSQKENTQYATLKEARKNKLNLFDCNCCQP